MKTKSDTAQRQAARKFVEYWTFQRGSEKGEDQQFWNSLLGEVLGMDDVKSHVQYQVPVPMKGTTKFLDAWIPETRVLIEHKSRGVSLDAPQAGHGGLTPYDQAAEYDAARPFDEKARWIVTCNFDEFRIYDRAKPLAPPLTLKLGNLPKEAYRLAFLVNPKEKAIDRELEISVQAGRIVGEIYDALLKQYNEGSLLSLRGDSETRSLGEDSKKSPSLQNSKTPSSESNYLAALNRLCVRLVFCLYAEDADIFPKDCFRRLMEATPAPFLRKRLIDLFQTLDTPPDKRNPYLEPELCAFPYTNGGLFKFCQCENVAINQSQYPIGIGNIGTGNTSTFSHSPDDIPPISEDIRQLLIGASQFDWREITPTIFGALFESTLNPVTRRSGGMVYTSVENIHKVIDPLFLNDLTRRVNECVAMPPSPSRNRRLLALQTETYICLRRLENRIIAALQQGQGELDLGISIKVSITQFFGLEINDFAVAVAKTALWIAESQMKQETAEILHREPDYLPLKDNANIVECNALRTEWPRTDYIIGNPPFLGYSSPGMTAESKADMAALFPKAKFLDYVCCWYKKAAALMQGTDARCAFVSTNSITQGEQVAPLWKDINCEIDFAHRTFIWDNEATEKAHVHCVIIGFHANGAKVSCPKIIFDGDKTIPAKHINGYLQDAPDAYIDCPKPVCDDVPQMSNGSKAVDGGNLFLKPEEKDALLKSYPAIVPFILLASGSDEYVNGIERWCLWLVDASPAQLRSCPPVMERIRAVREFRLSSSKEYTRRSAERPTLFQQIRQPDAPFIIIPRVSSENRRYIPMGFLQPNVVPTDLAHFVPNATPYHFGVMTSLPHMAWTRVTCGRLKSDYRYSAKLCYNSFVWPTVTDEMREKISATAQGILDARAAHPDCTLADLYDPLTMPADLRAAHEANDRAVLAAYGLAPDTPEPEIVAHLFKLYADKVKGLDNPA